METVDSQMNPEALKVLTKFLNVDLDVSTPGSIKALTKYLLTRKFYNLSVADERHASYEIDGDTRSANAVLTSMLDVLEKLPRDAEEAWLACTQREFNLGFDCGNEPLAFNEPIEPDLVRRIAALGGSLRITLYPALKKSAEDGQR